MKKLFYLMMVAATALFASCNPDNGEGTGTGNNGGGNTDKPFYGFEMDKAAVVNIGADQYVIQMYITDANGNNTRLMSAQVSIPGVVENVIPEGNYELIEGELIDDQYFAGSYYENAEAGYYMAITNGELNVKHTSKGTSLTVYADGYNAETQEAIDDIECRYTGDVSIDGNEFKGAQAVAQYQGLWEGVPYWILQIDIDETTWFNIYVNTNSEDFEAGIPSGNYPFNYEFTGGNADASYTSGDQWAGSMLLYSPDGETNYIVQLIFGGNINITNNGNGTYAIDMQYYDQTFIPYVANYEGQVALVDKSPKDVNYNLTSAEFTYMGGGYWSALVVEESGIEGYIDIYCGEDNTFADGIPAGTYTVSDTNAAGTVGAAVLEGGYITGGSYFVNGNSVEDLVVGGELVVNADKTFSFNFEGYFAPALKANFTGTPEFVDSTAAISLDVAQYMFLGGGNWLVLLGSTEKDALFMLEVYCAEDNTFADGLTAGTYTIADTCAPFTICPTLFTEEGAYDGGSALVSMDMQKLKDFILDGSMVIAEDGSATVNLVGYLNPVLNGVTTVEPTIVDGTEEEEPVEVPAKAAAKAPLKKAAKAIKVKNNLDKSTTYPFNGVVCR